MANSRRLALNMLAGIFSNFSRVGIQVLMLPFMAHVLGPEELGLAALAFPILAFVLLLSDAGLGSSLAREKETGTIVWSSAFWALLVLSILLALASYAASFFVAAVAKQPRLPGLMVPLCFAIVFAGVTIIPSALITRLGKNFYGSLFDLLANIAGVAVAIYLALNGAGVWSMAAQSLVMYAVRFVLFNAAFPFLPKFEFSFRSVLGHMGTGGALIGSRLADTGGRLAENAKVSRNLGSASLGAYGYANQIGRFFTEAVSNVVWANLYYLSLNRPQEKAAEDYLSAQRMLAIMVFPATAVLAPVIPIVVPILFGPRWADSIYPMVVLVISYPFLALGGLISAVLLAKNDTRFLLWSAVASGIARVIAVWVLYPYGLVAITYGLSVVNVLYFLLGSAVAANALGHQLKEHVIVIQIPLFAAVAAGLCLCGLLGPAPSMYWMLTASALCTGIYCAVLLVLDRRRTLADIRAVYGVIRRRRV